MKNLFFILLLLPLLLSCNEQKSDGNKKTAAPAKSATLSAPYELLVVANKEWLKTPMGERFMMEANPQVPGLPQAERNFRITSINPADFNNRFKVYANILYLDMNPKYKEPKLVLSRDVYVRPQIVLTVQVADNKALTELLTKNGQGMSDVFVEAELTRERAYLQSTHSGVVYDGVRRKFGYTICAPQDIDAINKDGDNFLWASSNQRDNALNVCVYTYPYTSSQNFTLDYFAHKRDSVMGLNVRGGKPDQYMVTERRTLAEAHKQFNGDYVYEVRGLWSMENDMMGGPFVSYSQVDTVRNLVVVTEGFVFAPEEKKRDLIRELEAMLQTLTL